MTDYHTRKRRFRGPAGIRPASLLLLLLIWVTSGCNRQTPVSSHTKPTVTTKNKLPPANSPPAESKADRSTELFSEPAVMQDAPQFRLTDQTGSPFGSEELRSCVWVVNFMFTKSTATCPRQTARFAELQRRCARWPDYDRIRLVSFTVDPENDTVEQLKQYADAHGADPARWKFLTGSRDELWTMSKDGFKRPVSMSDTDASSPITHSPQFVLVDSQQRVRGYYDGLAEDGFQKLLVDMRWALAASTPNREDTVHMPMPLDLFDPLWLEQKQADQLATADSLQVFHDFTFTDTVPMSGIRFVSRAVADSARDFKKNHYDHANGIAVADVDGDGLHDLYFVNQVGGNELWRNLGEGRFENITDRAGVSLRGKLCVSASFADTDNDGDPDLFVTTTRHGNVFFQNIGQGQFSDSTEKSGLGYIGHSSTGEFFDYDRDGKLDLFLTNVGSFTTDEIGYTGSRESREFPYFIGRESAFVGHLFPERYEQSILYHNDGDNRFRNVTRESGLLEPVWNGDATPLDANDDGWIDLYVANMEGRDEYYENIGGKRFELRSRNVIPVPVWGGMCVKSFDYNNDGRMDLFVTNMHADMWAPSKLIIGPQEKQKPSRDKFPDSYLRCSSDTELILGNALYEKTGSNQFREVSDQVNAENYWPWGHSVGDLNADGYDDVFIASSMNFPLRYQTNALLLNDHGKKFVDAEFILGIEPRSDNKIATPWFELDCTGPDASHPLVRGHKGRIVVWGALGSRSSAIFDIDQDGDLDIVTYDFNSPPMVLTSNLSQRNPDLHFLKIQLRGTQSNRDGLGTRVQVKADDLVRTQVHDGQSGYLSQSAMPMYFGIGKATMIDEISITWPSGNHQVVAGPIPVNQQLVIVEENSSR